MRETALRILTKNILPFWMGKMVDGEFSPQCNRGFLGRIAGDGTPDSTAPKGAVLNGRILWALSAAYRVLGTPEYLKHADYAYEWLSLHLIDRPHGGVFWSCDCNGDPLDTKKQTYAIGFAIYGLSEYVRALQRAGRDFSEPLEMAKELYFCLESHAYDPVDGGYFEAFQRDWTPIVDMRLSERDMNASKTMNTHLHVIEPYTNLYRVWPDEGLKAAIVRLVDIFADKILSCSFKDGAGTMHKAGHMGLFFTDDWTRIDCQLSYGHEIEAWWLLEDAMSLTGCRRDFSALRDRCLEFFDSNNPATEGLAYEIREDGTMDSDRHWWVQAEAVVGYHKIGLEGKEKATTWSEQILQFITNHLLHPDGEWFWSVRKEGGQWTPNTEDDLAGFWKCPYHNSRMCLELISD